MQMDGMKSHFSLKSGHKQISPKDLVIVEVEPEQVRDPKLEGKINSY
jgi:hypothetical protein